MTTAIEVVYPDLDVTVLVVQLIGSFVSFRESLSPRASCYFFPPKHLVITGPPPAVDSEILNFEQYDNLCKYIPRTDQRCWTCTVPFPSREKLSEHLELNTSHRRDPTDDTPTFDDDEGKREGDIHAWQLLYRGSRDGFTAKAFHERCDGRGPWTITV